MDISELLAFVVKNKASDLHLSSGLPPMIRVHGDVRRINLPPMEHKDVHAMVYDIMNDGQRKFYEENLECDFSFAIPNLARFREFESEPHLEMHPEDAAARGIRDGERVRVFNDRGGYTLKARVNGKPRRGVVVAPSVWWKKYARDGGNANNVTSQRTTDLGGGATFYDCRVQVERVDAPLR